MNIPGALRHPSLKIVSPLCLVIFGFINVYNLLLYFIIQILFKTPIWTAEIPHPLFVFSNVSFRS